MSVLIGHPTGNPNSHNAVVAYLEAGLLDSFCVPWMPGSRTTQTLKRFPPLRKIAKGLERRQFPALAHAPTVQGKVRECVRLLNRAAGWDGGGFAEQGNRWLMTTMARECHRSTVTAVHAYEDCSLWQFQEAKRLGKACVYDLPTVYYPAWERVQAELRGKYSDWMPLDEQFTADEGRLEQKRQEIGLADLVLVASRYVEATVREFYHDKAIARAPYGVDVEFWTPAPLEKAAKPLRFIYAGNVSLRKGVPLLIEAWVKAGLRDAELALVGSWGLAESKRASLPPGVTWFPPCHPQELRECYRDSDVFVFPTYSDGFGLVLLEAMACGLPLIATEASVAPEIITPASGRLMPPGDLGRLVELLRWFDRNRDELPAMGSEARSQAEGCTWENYRSLVADAVSKQV
jgi:alpha-maltose-1-phosphate synthase